MSTTLTRTGPAQPIVVVATTTAELQVSAAYSPGIVMLLGATPGSLVVDTQAKKTFVLTEAHTLQQIAAWS